MAVVFDSMDLHQRILREAPGTNAAHPLLAFFVENGVHDAGSAIRFKALQERFPQAYERLILEKRGQGKLFEGDGPHLKDNQQNTP